MTRCLPAIIILPLLALAATSAVASAGRVSTKPIKGATYFGQLRGEDELTIKVSRSGRQATASLVHPPLFCQGGLGLYTSQTGAAPISKSGSFKASIGYLSRGKHERFATVTIKGFFHGVVFQGTAKVVYPKSKECDGQESFQAAPGG
jgi:hypothetical protein